MLRAYEELLKINSEKPPEKNTKTLRTMKRLVLNERVVGGSDRLSQLNRLRRITIVTPV